MKNWKMERLKDRLVVALVFMLGMGFLGSCWCINEEGFFLLRFKERIERDPFGGLSSWKDEEIDPCSWPGVECYHGMVVALNLTDLCLEGNLAPEIGRLVHIKAINLRNNSFLGIVPQEIGEMKSLQVLDLGYNNFSLPLPSNLGKSSSLSTLFLDNNELLLSAKISWSTQQRKILQNGKNEGEDGLPSPTPSPSDPNASQAIAPESPASPLPPSPASQTLNPPSELHPSPPPLSTVRRNASSHTAMVVSIAVGVSAVSFSLIVFGLYYYRRRQMSVKHGGKSLSEHMEKAFLNEVIPARISGVPKLKRSELETACEDFSNVVGSSSIGTIYKGTLSSGAEIAVAKWSTNLEAQFKKKIEKLSKVHHKNFLNLVGYCEEEDTCTRMMVFEYASNGTLLEHLHVKEAEFLDWRTRLRIAMGVAYCLDHMHQLNPPILHRNLTSSAIMLTEDYTAKLSSFIFWNQISVTEIQTSKPDPIELLAENYSAGPERDVYNFGVVLFQMVTARLPYSVDNGLLDDWASDYVRGDRPIRHMVDPALASFDMDQVEQIGRVIKDCVHPSPDHRPAMAGVCERLRIITGILPEEAATKLSPLWWAELEIMSTEGV